MDDEQTGVSTGLLMFDVSSPALKPSSTAEVTFQAVNDNGDGVPDQAVEVVITDLTRLRFKGSPNNRKVVMTDRSDKVGGVLVSGAVVVELVVPADANPGPVDVVASLAGDRGTSSKTQWASFDIGAAGTDAGVLPSDAWFDAPDGGVAGSDQTLSTDDAGEEAAQ